jgi:hypothetical protein
MQWINACEELGITPDRLEQVLDPGIADVEPTTVEKLKVSMFLVYAARLKAGEKHASVAAANDIPIEDVTWGNDDPEPEEDPAADPTPPDSEGDESPPSHPES